jgi:hypothetical protein
MASPPPGRTLVSTTTKASAGCDAYTTIEMRKVRIIKDGGGRRDGVETDGGARGCTPRAGKVRPRSNPGTLLS